MNNDYGKAYKEVLVILKSLSEEDFSKIPEEEIKFYEENSDKDYDFKIDTNILLEEQNISRMANSILISIYMDYFVTDEQKRLVKDILRLNRRKEENEKSRNYAKNNEMKLKNEEDKLKVKELCIVEERKCSTFSKLIKFFKNIFRIKE